MFFEKKGLKEKSPLLIVRVNSRWSVVKLSGNMVFRNHQTVPVTHYELHKKTHSCLT